MRYIPHHYLQSGAKGRRRGTRNKKKEKETSTDGFWADERGLVIWKLRLFITVFIPHLDKIIDNSSHLGNSEYIIFKKNFKDNNFFYLLEYWFLIYMHIYIYIEERFIKIFCFQVSYNRKWSYELYHLSRLNLKKKKRRLTF